MRGLRKLIKMRSRVKDRLDNILMGRYDVTWLLSLFVDRNYARRFPSIMVKTAETDSL